ncbi:MAG: GspE/PulE family protein [Pseudomonadales bacterium]
MIPRKQKVRIGDLLVANGELTEEQLMECLAEQKKSGMKLGKIIVDHGYIDEEKFLQFLSQQFEIPYYNLKDFALDLDLVAQLPETYSRRYRALVLEEQNGELVVGMVDPMDIFAYDELSRQLGRPVSVAVVRESELVPMLDMAYRRTSDIVSFASELEGELNTERFSLKDLDSAEQDSSTPIAKLLNSIMEDAVQVRASDVHIEPDADVLRIRQRVDGVLQEQIIKETRIATALVSRLKLMAGLDISEKRLPQDGRFDMNLKGRAIDVRLSTMPVQDGESVVMRLADHSGAASNLDQVGMPELLLERFRGLIRRPNGLILVTGPTGSGKTTTLYGALNELNAPEKKIITVEDPVEFELPRINQVQVRQKIGLDFAKVLRATLRQDPDILLLGEIRDKETADIALRASMTGHLVLSTLHTNDAVSSAIRLLDIGVEGFLAASALRCIVAQRLVRRLCDRCVEDAEPDDQQFAWLDALVGEKRAHEMRFRQGKGCNRCNRTGFFGRIGVFELLELNEELGNALRREDSEAFARLAHSQPGFRPLVLSALDYALAGETSLAEVLSLSGQVEDLRALAGDSVEPDSVAQTDSEKPLSLQALELDEPVTLTPKH